MRRPSWASRMVYDAISSDNFDILISFSMTGERSTTTKKAITFQQWSVWWVCLLLILPSKKQKHDSTNSKHTISLSPTTCMWRWALWLVSFQFYNTYPYPGRIPSMAQTNGQVLRECSAQWVWLWRCQSVSWTLSRVIEDHWNRNSRYWDWTRDTDTPETWVFFTSWIY